LTLQNCPFNRKRCLKEACRWWEADDCVIFDVNDSLKRIADSLEVKK